MREKRADVSGDTRQNIYADQEAWRMIFVIRPGLIQVGMVGWGFERQERKEVLKVGLSRIAQFQ